MNMIKTSVPSLGLRLISKFKASGVEIYSINVILNVRFPVPYRIHIYRIC
jgi:hypothetical protein